MSLNTRKSIMAIFSITLGTSMVWTYGYAQPAERVIQIVTKKFNYTPNIIKLKKGVPVILEFTTQDVFMGFNVPDLKMRTDIIPGKATQLRLMPEKAGTFPFVCDVFCGNGHEDMTGSIIVSE